MTQAIYPEIESLAINIKQHPQYGIPALSPPKGGYYTPQYAKVMQQKKLSFAKWVKKFPFASSPSSPFSSPPSSPRGSETDNVSSAYPNEDDLYSEEQTNVLDNITFSNYNPLLERKLKTMAIILLVLGFCTHFSWLLSCILYSKSEYPSVKRLAKVSGFLWLASFALFALTGVGIWLLIEFVFLR